MLLKIIFLSNFIFVVFAQDTSDSVISELEEESSEKSGELRDYHQDWRADEHHQDPSDWIPREESDEQPKRRRIRKRKRRPTEEFVHSQRPHRLDQFQERLWDEMSAETVQQPYKRRRITPVYQEETETIRDPFSALLEAEEKQKSLVEEHANGADLKLLLKQNEGTLSLSEVLQQKNLSLSELLMGNQKAISALTERTDDFSTEEIIDFPTTEPVKYQRLPPSIALRKTTNRHLSNSESPLTSRETLEAQRKRLSLLHSHKENKLFVDIPKFDVVTEQTTEKRIFVPSNPKYTTINFLPDFQHTEKSVTLAPSTTTQKIVIKKFNYENRVAFKPKTRPHLPITSAKMNKLSRPTVTILPKAITIDVNEIFGFDQPKTTTTQGPMKMSIDLEKTTEKPTTIESVPKITAKDEIMEILKDPIGRENLSKILKLRNMTIVELVEQRERGSSQVHLADIFHNETREPEPKEEPHTGTISEDFFYTFPLFGRKAKQLEPKPEIVTIPPKETVAITSFPTYKIESDKSAKQKPQTFLSDWKQLYPTVFQDVYASENKENEATTTEEVKRLEQVDNQLTESSNDRLNIDLNYSQDEEEFISFPSGIKSAIIASFAIIGLSLLVFLTILVIFKWNQKHKHIFNYSNSFSGSRIKSPILDTIQKRTLRNFMNETLMRKKYCNKSQNIPDNIWENERKVYM